MRLATVTLALWAGLCWAGSVEGRVQTITLANGMIWLVVERPDAPVFTGYVRVRVGGADEGPGETGLAHLFEHLAFKGTAVLGARDWARESPLLDELERVGDRLSALERAGQGSEAERAALLAERTRLSTEARALADDNALARLYLTQGGVGLNATTDKDLTSYFVSLPRNRLELWLRVEASRLAAPVLRDFYTEREVVQEERRMSIDASPGGVLHEQLDQLAFVASPYRWPTVGWAADLRTLSRSAARAFHDRFYVASNAVGCVVGDVQVDEVRRLLEATFGQLPRVQRPPEPVFTEPPPRAQRRAQVRYDASPRLVMAFPKPAPPARDDLVLDVIEVLLAEGHTGRLTQRLVYRDHLAQSVNVSEGPGQRLDGLVSIQVAPLSGVPLAAVEAAVWEELSALARSPPEPAELSKARTRVAADLERSLDGNAEIASALSRAQALWGDWRLVFTRTAEVESVTGAEVQAVAGRLFAPEHAVIVTLGREGEAR